MYCNHCGAELPDGSKFCQDCGTVTKAAAAEQKAKKKVETPPPAPTPSPSDTKKSSKKKVNPLLIAIIIVVIAAVGSLVGKFAIAPSLSDSESDTNTTSNILGTSEAPEPGIIDEPIEILPPSDNPLSDITFPDWDSNNGAGLAYDYSTQATRTWIFKYDDNNILTVIADYSTANNRVDHIKFQAEINTDFPKYNQMKTELQAYYSMFETLNDPQADLYNLSEYVDGSLYFYGHVYDLCGADRADRVSLMSTVLGVPYDTTNNSFSITTLSSTLTTAGFAEQ